MALAIHRNNHNIENFLHSPQIRSFIAPFLASNETRNLNSVSRRVYLYTFNNIQAVFLNSQVRSYLTFDEIRNLRTLSKRCYFVGKQFSSPREYETAHTHFFAIAFRNSMRTSFFHSERRGAQALSRHIWRYSPENMGFNDFAIPVLLSLSAGFAVDQIGSKSLDISLLPTSALALISIVRSRDSWTGNYVSFANNIFLILFPLVVSIGLRVVQSHAHDALGLFPHQCHPLEGILRINGFLMFIAPHCLLASVNFNLPAKTIGIITVLNVATASEQSLFAIANSLFMAHLATDIPWSRLEHRFLRKLVATYLTASSGLPLLMRHTVRQVRSHLQGTPQVAPRVIRGVRERFRNFLDSIFFQLPVGFDCI